MNRISIPFCLQRPYYKMNKIQYFRLLNIHHQKLNDILFDIYDICHIANIFHNSVCSLLDKVHIRYFPNNN